MPHTGEMHHTCTISERLNKALLLLMLLTWGWGWDPFSQGQYMRDGRLKIFLISSIAIAAVQFSKTWHWSIGILYAYITGIFVLSGIPSFGVVDIALITATLLLVPIIFEYISLKEFETTVIATAVLNSAVAYFNFFGVYFFKPADNAYNYLKPIIGLMGQHTLLSAFLVFSLGFSVNRGKVYPSLFILGAILLSNSSMGYLSLAASSAIFVLFHYGVTAVFAYSIIGIMMATVVVSVKPELLELSGRAEIWPVAVEKIRGRPWIGHGTGSWSAYAGIIASNSKTPTWTQLHSDWMQQLLEWGRVGAALIAVTFVKILGRAHFVYLFKDREHLPYVAGLICFAVNSIANFGMHITPHGQLAAICAYILIRKS